MVIILVLIIFIILLSILYNLFYKIEEKFNDDFDKVLDNKCRLLSGNRMNNYLGPWDGNRFTTICSKYMCGTETCSVLERDTSLSQAYGTNYKWNIETMPKIMNEDTTNQTFTCSTNHGTTHNIHDTVIDCQQQKFNDYNHNMIDVCFEYNNNIKEWERKRYIKVLDQNGVYSWRQIGNMNVTKPEEDIMSCRKQPVDCSLSNYYCCEQPGYPDQCLTRRPNVNDQQIVYRIDPSDSTGERCITNDVCGAQTCYASSDFVKNCWSFNTYAREWENNIHTRQFRNNVCDFFDRLGNRYDETRCAYFDGLPNPPYTDEKCAIENSPITCQFMTDTEDLFSKTYESRLNYRGDGCVYEALSGDEILNSDVSGNSDLRNNSSFQQGYPHFLSDNDLCPVLTPENCQNPEHFLKMYNDPRTSPRCMECPPDTYRNDAVLAYHESTACSSNATCTPIGQCTDDNPTCVKCMKRLDDDPHGNKFEIIYTQTIPDKDQCVVEDDRVCEKNEQGDYVQCDPNHIVYFSEEGKGFCDNCVDGYKLDVDAEGNVECRRTYTCSRQRTKCLDKDGIEFSYHIYKNEDDDEFNPCVWTDEMTNNKLERCLTECPPNHYRVDEGNEDYCSQVQN